MGIFSQHVCQDNKIRCFDCRKVICQQCMLVTPTSLMCKNCSQKSGKPDTPRQLKVAGGSKLSTAQSSTMALAIASVVYSAMLVKLLNVLAPYVGGMGFLASGLLGIGLAVTLMRIVEKNVRRKMLPMVLIGILFGTFLVHAIDCLLLRLPRQTMIPGWGEALNVALILLMVTVKFRQQPR